MNYFNMEENDTNDSSIYEEFLGSRCLTPKVQEIISKYSRNHSNLYRGIPMNREEIIEEGSIIEEWNCSSHWSTDLKIAENFSDIDKAGYLLDDLYPNQVKRLIMFCGTLQGISARDINPNSKFASEQEVTVVGFDFKVVRIISETEEETMVEVIPMWR